MLSLRFIFFKIFIRKGMLSKSLSVFYKGFVSSFKKSLLVRSLSFEYFLMIIVLRFFFFLVFKRSFRQRSSSFKNLKFNYLSLFGQLKKVVFLICRIVKDSGDYKRLYMLLINYVINDSFNSSVLQFKKDVFMIKEFLI